LEELAAAGAEEERREAEAEREREQTRQSALERAFEDAELAAGLIRSVRPEFRTPGPFLGHGEPVFMFSPAEMYALLLDLTRRNYGSRVMPVAVALNYVLGHDVVLMHSSDEAGEAQLDEWGHLTEASYYERDDLLRGRRAGRLGDRYVRRDRDPVRRHRRLPGHRDRRAGR
jgi:hypothetical protein